MRGCDCVRWQYAGSANTIDCHACDRRTAKSDCDNAGNSSHADKRRFGYGRHCAHKCGDAIDASYCCGYHAYAERNFRAAVGDRAGCHNTDKRAAHCHTREHGDA